ncbi:MAG: hypothetical protein MK108_15555 [Mariniblastus sp.]|nr:hypothetical protein [Mariniblastus sp.]
MKNTIATWEDEENNRHIQFLVAYAIENNQVEIKSVTPNKISFVCPTTNTVTRAVGIHTETGQAFLASKIQAAGQISAVADEIAQREGLLVSA